MARNLRIEFEIGQLRIGGPQSWLCDIAPALRQRGPKVIVMSFEGFFFALQKAAHLAADAFSSMRNYAKRLARRFDGTAHAHCYQEILEYV
ncbi:MAG: hypothetical protein NT154_13355 [Verrucomicrobia bacterium]|nr:hypothetical protein [Verrucomicrobiota bacterium]